MTRLELEWFSYQQLAAMWHRPARTIMRWISEDRRRGHALPGYYRLDRHHRRREFLLRGDAAAQVWARHGGGR